MTIEELLIIVGYRHFLFHFHFDLWYNYHNRKVSMNIAIVVYNGIDIWELSLAYTAFKSLKNVNLKIFTDNKIGEIVTKDKSLLLGGFDYLYDLEQTDILWICEGESKIDELNNDEAFKYKLLQLSSRAKKTVCIGGSSTFIVDLLDREKSVASHPIYQKLIKKKKLNYVSDVVLNNDDIISTSSRAGCIFAIENIYREFFTVEEFSELLTKFDLDDLKYDLEINDKKKRIKNLKKLHKHILKLEYDVNNMKLKVDSTKDSLAFYVQEDFDFLTFALIYSVMSNDSTKTQYIVGDRVGNFYVEGRSFYIKATHSLHQIKRVVTLVLTGGKVVDNRLSDKFLIHWIADIVPKTARVISLDSSDKLLGVAGVLVDFDPVLELSDAEKAKLDGKFVFLQNAKEVMIYLKHNLKSLADGKVLELLKSEYFIS